MHPELMARWVAARGTPVERCFRCFRPTRERDSVAGRFHRGRSRFPACRRPERHRARPAASAWDLLILRANTQWHRYRLVLRREYRKIKRPFPPTACAHPVLRSARTPRTARPGARLAGRARGAPHASGWPVPGRTGAWGRKGGAAGAARLASLFVVTTLPTLLLAVRSNLEVNLRLR
jgi:hypothetical protein